MAGTEEVWMPRKVHNYDRGTSQMTVHWLHTLMKRWRKVKGKIYRTIVLSTILCGAETRIVYRRQVKKLHAFMMRHMRSIMRNKEIRERTGLPSMEDRLIRKNLRWTGHPMGMSPDRLAKQILYSQLSSGHRKRERPRLRFKDTIKRNLKLRDIKIDSWTSLSQQRDKWRATVK